MNQKVPDELISAYFDGEVTPEERVEVERLLESSSELRQELDDTAKLSALLHSFPRELAPAELAANVRRRVEAATVVIPAGSTRKRFRVRRDWLAFASGMCVTMALLLVYVAVNPLAPSNQVANRHDDLALSKWKQPAKATLQTPAEISAKDSNLAMMDDVERMRFGAPVAESVAPPAPAVAMSAEFKESQNPQGDIQQFDRLFDSKGEQPLSPEDFLSMLKSGAVFVMKDPNESVPVLQLTVVDIERGAEGLKLAFHKRSVNQVEDEAPQSADLARKDVPGAKKLSSARKYQDADDLMVIFVRASGDRLVDAISDAQNDHPDLYRQTTPQLPLDLNLNGGTLVANNSVAAPTNGPVRESDKADGSTPTTGQESFEVEADLVVKTYADLNGKAIDNSIADAYKDARRKPRGQVALNELKNANKQTEDIARAATPAQPDVPSKVEGSGADKALADNNDVLQGYKTFHMVLGKQQQAVDQPIPQARSMLAQQGVMARGNSGVNNGYVTNNGINPMSAMTGNTGVANPGLPGGPRYGLRGGRGPSDNARLSRLLIVLKQDKQDAQQDNAPAAPAPNN